MRGSAAGRRRVHHDKYPGGVNHVWMFREWVVPGKPGPMRLFQMGGGGGAVNMESQTTETKDCQVTKKGPCGVCFKYAHIVNDSTTAMAATPPSTTPSTTAYLPPVKSDSYATLINTYIHYGWDGRSLPAAPNCTAFVALFSPPAPSSSSPFRPSSLSSPSNSVRRLARSTMLSPMGAGPTGITDLTDPANVCAQVNATGAKFTANTVIGAYSQIEMSASFSRIGFKWAFHCPEGGQDTNNTIFTNLWIIRAATGDYISNWQGGVSNTFPAAIDTPTVDGRGMCPLY